MKLASQMRPPHPPPSPRKTSTMTMARPPHKLTLDILESAFLGSEFFPLRMKRGDEDVIDATKDGGIYATVRIVGNAIIVEQVGRGSAAAARATRVSQMLKRQKAAAEAQPYSADAEWARRMDPEQRGPYTIRRLTKGGSAGKILAQHLTRQQLRLRLDTCKDESKFLVVDESDGIEACAVDTGEVPDWKLCECYRCALKSEALAKGPRTYTVEQGGEVFGLRPEGR